MLVAAAAAIFAAPAAAESCKAPPGMSAIDQYCEAIPSPGGDRGSGDRDRGGLPYSAATQRALERAGADGAGITAMSAHASRSERSRARSSPRGASHPKTLPVKVAPDKPSSDPLSAVTSGFGTAGSTAGAFFGTVLLFLALVFFATAWLRYRRRPQD